jgi:hypothetical protein
VTAELTGISAEIDRRFEQQDQAISGRVDSAVERRLGGLEDEVGGIVDGRMAALDLDRRLSDLEGRIDQRLTARIAEAEARITAANSTRIAQAVAGIREEISRSTDLAVSRATGQVDDRLLALRTELTEGFEGQLAETRTTLERRIDTRVETAVDTAVHELRLEDAPPAPGGTPGGTLPVGPTIRRRPR